MPEPEYRFYEKYVNITLFGIYNFGLRALLVVVITVASSVFFEWIYDKLMHKKNTITVL